ncbi:response regulator [Methanoregula sp. PtaB.Bin085]|uniref:response regulator n=1 Tax=Methanoregula sp. PtaB.Bin085 TaxID=1811680 RepID=UPI0009CC5555|nr:response regulator [Methanoregula sp. PtaB.Bin085]OPX63749.1 MAG: response regulator FixJ [Methanoregula sp. PtaB.Bin085]
MYSILYVDDDENLLGLNKIFMERTGEFTVDTVSSATEALERIPGARYDAILSDYQMPEMDGIEFLKVVRSRHGNLPFILFTGRGREDVVIEAVNNGVDYYIQKGPDLKSMITELRHKTLRAIERRQIEAELKRSREELNDIINFLPDATCVIDTAGTVISWNRAMEQMTGIPRQEILGKGDYAYAVPFYGTRQPVLVDYLLHDLPGLESRYPGAEKNERKISAELYVPSLRGGEGAYIWVSASLLYDSSGKVTGGIETVRDMTEVHRIKHDLGISREMNRGFANMIPVGIYEMDLFGTLTFANGVCLGYFGLSKEDMDRKISIFDFIADEDRERASRDIRRIISGESGTGREYLLQRKDGSTFYGLIYGVTVTDPDSGRVTGVRGIIVDQTLRRKEARELYESRERLALALQAGDIGIWDVDMRTMLIHDIDEWALRVLGIGAGPGRVFTVNTAKSLAHPLDLPRILYAFFRHMADRETLFEVEFRLRHSNGSWVWMTVRGKVIERDSFGHPLRITGTINTIPGPRDSRFYPHSPKRPDERVAGGE